VQPRASAAGDAAMMDAPSETTRNTGYLGEEDLEAPSLWRLREPRSGRETQPEDDEECHAAAAQWSPPDNDSLVGRL
jgi:hypothetical protein